MIRRTIWIIVTSGVYKKPSVLFSRYIYKAKKINSALKKYSFPK